MASQDWHDALSALAQDLGGVASLDEAHDDLGQPDGDEVQKGTLHIVLERKGRGGKTATIICGFTLGDESLKALAADMKKSLGCGGSARGGEILIQGDRSSDCRHFLVARGFKVK